MLQTFTVEPRTLVLLERLQALPMLSNTRLVGGTGLSLQFGHRTSIDLDLFGDIDMTNLVDELGDENFEEFIIDNNSKSIKQFKIDGVKVDIVNYKYKWLKPPICTNNIRIAEIEDIAAMKISAITGRGSKKDFIDLYFLLKHFTLEQIIGFYVAKYPDSSLMMVYKSLSYFLDAEAQDMPRMFEAVSWEEVKAEMVKQIENI